MMQRKIAEELELDLGIMAKFDEQDEEDDFNGVDYASRDVIPSVWQAVAQTLMYRKVLMVFLNGSDDTIDVSRFGINPEYCDHVKIWTFKRQSLTIQDRDREDHFQGVKFHKVRYTRSLIGCATNPVYLKSSELSALLCEEAVKSISNSFAYCFCILDFC